MTEHPRAVRVGLRVDDRNPGHVHVSVFAGRNPGARGHAGKVTFRSDEWDEIMARYGSGPFVLFVADLIGQALPDAVVDVTDDPPGLSHYDYEAGRRLAGEGFYALLSAAMRRADSANADRLRAAFPGVWSDLQARYDSPGGYLPGDQG